MRERNGIRTQNILNRCKIYWFEYDSGDNECGLWLTWNCRENFSSKSSNHMLVELIVGFAWFCTITWNIYIDTHRRNKNNV